MKVPQTRIRFRELRGQLHAVEVVRSSSRPIISALHRALFAAGVVITSYRVQATSGGLRERMELSSSDGQALSDQQSELVRTATLPLALSDDTPTES